MSRTIRVDFTDVESGFAPIPEGVYPATVLQCEETVTRETNKPMIKVTFRLREPGLENRMAFTNWVLDPKALWRMKQDLQRLGYGNLNSMVDIDLDDLIGRECRLRITHQLYNGQTYDNVEEILPAAEVGETLGAGSDPVKPLRRL